MSIHAASTGPPAGLACTTVDACEQVSSEEVESSSEVQSSSHFLLLVFPETGDVTSKISSWSSVSENMLSVMLTGDMLEATLIA